MIKDSAELKILKLGANSGNTWDQRKRIGRSRKNTSIDGTIPFQVFKLHFENTASANNKQTFPDCEITYKVATGNVAAVHKFIVAQTIDEVIIGVYFLLDQGIKMNVH